MNNNKKEKVITKFEGSSNTSKYSFQLFPFLKLLLSVLNKGQLYIARHKQSGYTVGFVLFVYPTNCIIKPPFGDISIRNNLAPLGNKGIAVLEE